MDEHSLFIELLEIDDLEKRQERLVQRVGEDESMRSRIEGLLEAHQRASGFMESSLEIDRASIETPAMSTKSMEQPGDVIGPYKLLQQIGEGGMGVVYMAEQSEPVRRKVALKIVKAGMDSRQVVARFEAERQALAMMNHPNIAKVLDAGATETGRPYFVMELVRGIPITEFCDTQKLTMNERMDLFITVCQAVHHAHQKGVIHRDLKPSNLLVELHDVRPVPKVIDFGIAKATDQKLTDKTLFTNFAQLIGTPVYMSPEQAQMSGLDIDVRSDVYSLGVLLYELLTGTTPVSKETLNQVGYDELRRMISEQEPPRPSGRISTLKAEAKTTLATNRRTDIHRIHRLIRGELDWVLAKALEKDRTRRYQSAVEFAVDVQRFLDGEPVEAHPPSVVYRVSKIIRRHRGLATTAALIFLTLIGATVVSARYAYKATEASQDAEARRQEAVREREAAKAARIEAEEGKRLAVTEQERAEVQRNEAQRLQQLADEQREEIGRNLYIADMRLAGVDRERLNIRGTTEKLRKHHTEAQESEYASWEWYYLLGQCHSFAISIPSPGPRWVGHVWNTSGELYAVDGDASIHRINVDTATGDTYSKVLDLDFDYFDVKLRWDETRNRLVMLAGSSEVAFTDLTDGSQFGLENPDGLSLNHLGLSPDGRYLVTLADANPGTLQVWDIETRQIMKEYPLSSEQRTRSVSWHPSKARFAASGRYKPSGFRIYNLSEEQPYAVYLDGETISDVEYTRDGKHVIASSQFGELFVVDSDSGKVVTERRQGAGIRKITLSPDGSRLAVAGAGGLISIWDTESWTHETTLTGQNSDVNDLDWSPDGTMIVANIATSMRFWSKESLQRSSHRSGPPVEFGSIQWLSEEEFGVTANDGRRSVISVDGSTAAEELANAPSGLANVHDATAGSFDAIFGFDWAKGKSPFPDRGTNAIQKFALSRSGSYLAAASIESFTENPYATVADQQERLLSIGIWEMDSKNLLMSCLYRPGASVFSFSPVESMFASAGTGKLENSVGSSADQHGHLVLFDVRSGNTHDYKISGVISQSSAIAWNRNGTKIATGNRDGHVNVFDLDAEAVQFDRLVLGDHVKALSWSVDGRRIACGDRSGLIVLIDAETGEEVLEMGNADAEVLDLRFSPNGRKLAGYFADGNYKIWDAGRGYEYAASDEYRIQILDQQISELVAEKKYSKAKPLLLELRELFTADSIFINWLSECYLYEREMASLEQSWRRLANEVGQSNIPVLYRVALTQAANKSLGQFSATCQTMENEVDGNASVTNRMWVIGASVLAPDAFDDYAKVVELARGVVEEYPENTMYQGYLGAILLRAGKADEAIDYLQKAVDSHSENSPSTYSMYFLSMAYHELGDAEQASQWLERANEEADKTLATGSAVWYRRLILELLREEATAKVGESESVDKQ